MKKAKKKIIQEIKIKRGEYTRKRTKRIRRVKNILKYQRKHEKVKPSSDAAPLHSGIAHQSSVIHPGGMTRWQRFWNFIKKLLHL